MKCPRCGFVRENDVISRDLFLCGVWAYLYLANKTLPNEEQFVAMQKVGLLPVTKSASDGSGRTYILIHGHYGYRILHDWPAIAAKTLIMAGVKI
ncbi:MAG: hypothetical protein WCI36_05285 [bacterium]